MGKQFEESKVKELAPRYDGSAVTILYVNHRGERVYRRILPRSIRFAATEWHPEPQWLLEALDLDRNVERSFALEWVLNWRKADG